MPNAKASRNVNVYVVGWKCPKCGRIVPAEKDSELFNHSSLCPCGQAKFGEYESVVQT